MLTEQIYYAREAFIKNLKYIGDVVKHIHLMEIEIY